MLSLPIRYFTARSPSEQQNQDTGHYIIVLSGLGDPLARSVH